MRFYVYKRDSGGLIIYHGSSDGWPSETECVTYYGIYDNINPMPEPHIEEMMGWLHSKVRWYGDVGVAINDAV